MDEMLRIAVFGDSLMKGTLPDEQLRYHFPVSYTHLTLPTKA